MKKHLLLLVCLLAVFAAGSLALWLLGSERWSALGLNLFTDTLGIAITVFLIDKLIQAREQARTLPQRLVAFEDVRLLTIRRVGFWYQAYMAAVPGTLPTHVRDLLSPEAIGRIRAHLDMDSEPNVVPPRTWWSYLPQETVSFQRAAERILERHSTTLDPIAFQAVYTALHASLDANASTAMLQADQQIGFPRPRILGAYLCILPEHFTALLDLVDWLVSEKAALSKVSSSARLGVIDVELSGVRPDGTPPCMIAPAKLAAQLKAQSEYRERSGQPP